MTFPFSFSFSSNSFFVYFDLFKSSYRLLSCFSSYLIRYSLLFLCSLLSSKTLIENYNSLFCSSITFSILTMLFLHYSIIFCNLWGSSINFFTFYCRILSTKAFRLIPTETRFLFLIFELVVAIDDPKPFSSEKEASRESMLSSWIEKLPLFWNMFWPLIFLECPSGTLKELLGWCTSYWSAKSEGLLLCSFLCIYSIVLNIYLFVFLSILYF